MRYLNDFRSGDTVALGQGEISATEAREFAERYDPQPQYLDDTLSQPLHGGTVASQWQVAALGQSLLVSGLLNRTAHHGMYEVSELKFHRPVHPFETLTAEMTVTEVRDADGHRDRGEVCATLEMWDGDEAPVLTMNGVLMVAKKPRH